MSSLTKEAAFLRDLAKTTMGTICPERTERLAIIANRLDALKSTTFKHIVMEHRWSSECAAERMAQKMAHIDKAYDGRAEVTITVQTIPQAVSSLYLFIVRIPA